MCIEVVMLISDKGTLVRTSVEEVRVMGRNTQGVRLIKLIEGENLVGLQNVVEIDSDEDEAEQEHAEGTAETAPSNESESTNAESSSAADDSDTSDDSESSDAE